MVSFVLISPFAIRVGMVKNQATHLPPRLYRPVSREEDLFLRLRPITLGGSVRDTSITDDAESGTTPGLLLSLNKGHQHVTSHR